MTDLKRMRKLFYEVTGERMRRTEINKIIKGIKKSVRRAKKFPEEIIYEVQKM